MPRFTVDGEKLFLAELTAHSVVSEMTVESKIAGVFDVRHKVAENRLKEIYDACGLSESNSYERLLNVSKLLVFSSAAYSATDCKALIETSREGFFSVSVSPHFGGRRELKLAYPNEPMNLWYGTATENREKNQDAIDPHLVKVDTHRGIKYQVSQVSNQSARSDSPTRNERFGEVFAEETALVFKGPRADSPERKRPSKPAVSTPVSKMLETNEDALEWEFGGFEHSLYGPKELVKQLEKVKIKNLPEMNASLKKHHEKLLQDMKDMQALIFESNNAGLEHYSHLLQEMDKREINRQHDFYLTLKNAEKEWKVNRNSLHQLVANQSQLLANKSRELVQNRKKTGVMVPKEFFLRPLKL